MSSAEKVNCVAAPGFLSTILTKIIKVLQQMACNYKSVFRISIRNYSQAVPVIFKIFYRDFFEKILHLKNNNVDNE